MRRGSGSSFMEENGKLIAINLGSDFCAEHEWGIKHLKFVLGIDEDKEQIGIEKRRVNPKPNAIYLLDEGDNVALIVESRYSKDREYKIQDYRELSLREWKGEKDELACAWDESSLGAHVRGEKNIKKLRKIYDALLAKDAAVWLGGGGVFQNAGLVIGIISNIPAVNLKTMADADKDRNALVKEHEKIGIKARLDKLNNEYRESHGGYHTPCGYFACSPHWASRDMKTKYKVMYWLNPEQQDRVNYGYFSVEDLELWMKGEGPIPMSKEQKENRNSRK